MEKNNTRILVVDDDSGIGEMLKMLLEMNGYKVLISEDPEKTEENIIAHDIDLVILDMLISGVNGTDVCARLRRNETTKHVTLLMMSALQDVGKRCKAAGADNFIAKPFEIDKLLGKIKCLIKGIV